MQQDFRLGTFRGSGALVCALASAWNDLASERNIARRLDAADRSDGAEEAECLQHSA
ncbi:MAG: hypothetical protein ACREFP_14045 [Acetobacteraceae bacterium]